MAANLTEKLVRAIRFDGPISVARYMHLCLHDPEFGYYTRGAGLGRDFITAPELTQVFGELLAVWVRAEWETLGRPDPFLLCELGPGRGTLMADLLRALPNLPDGTGCAGALRLHLVEASPVLRKQQAGALKALANPTFHHDVGDVPEGPAIFIGNEFLDCLPARQFALVDGRPMELQVGLGEQETLVLGRAKAEAHDGASQEAQETQLGLGAHLAHLGGREAPLRALYIDYGPERGPVGDTLRAYRNGAQVHPLEAPGACDLTVDVDFAEVARLGAAAGLAVSGPVEQGVLLRRLGVEARLKALIGANPDRAAEIFAPVQRLVAPDDMGSRFKAICLSSAGLPAPVGFGEPA